MRNLSINSMWDMKFRYRGWLLTMAVAMSGVLPGGTVATANDELLELSLEKLMQVEVFTASRNPQALAKSAAAVYVITEEDIRRSGVTSIPEALRLAPGLQVARLDANKWAVSARGFNGQFANKLLVLIDGRSVYTPLFSGVYWDVQDTALADIERIEVIRGPGAALWGANGVNGVINIITKKASETQGTSITVGGGSEDRLFSTVRHGGKLSKSTHYRTYLKYSERDNSEPISGSTVADEWDAYRAGFRLDSDVTLADELTIQGDIYEGDQQTITLFPLLAPPFVSPVQSGQKVSGGNLLLRWKGTQEDGSSHTLQLYYDRTEQDTPLLHDERDIIDLDFQHGFNFTERHQLTWGAGYRFVHDQLGISPLIFFEQTTQDDHLFSAFIQDEISIEPDTLKLILGSRFEHNDYTGVEIQPNGRLIWTPDDSHSVWGAISRAVRTPSRAEENIQYDVGALPAGAIAPGSPPAFITLMGSEDFDSEKLTAYELGYRSVASPKVSFDATAFWNEYNHLRSLETGLPIFSETPSPGPRVPTRSDNKLEGHTYGFELSSDVKALDWWHLKATYSLLEMHLSTDADSTDTMSEKAEKESPAHQAALFSMMNFPQGVELDLWLRYVDSLPALDVDSYITLDVRLGWDVSEKITLSVVGQNLLEQSHQEFAPEFASAPPAEIERAIYAKATITF